MSVIFIKWKVTQVCLAIRNGQISRWLFAGAILALMGCSSAENEMAGGNLRAVNHTIHAINWFSINGYRAHGGGGSSCCIVMPIKWRPGLMANIEWEVDPEPFAKIKRKTSGFGLMMTHGLSTKQTFSAIVRLLKFRSGQVQSAAG